MERSQYEGEPMDTPLIVSTSSESLGGEIGSTTMPGPVELTNQSQITDLPEELWSSGDAPPEQGAVSIEPTQDLSSGYYASSDRGTISMLVDAVPQSDDTKNRLTQIQSNLPHTYDQRQEIQKTVSEEAAASSDSRNSSESLAKRVSPRLQPATSDSNAIKTKSNPTEKTDTDEVPSNSSPGSSGQPPAFRSRSTSAGSSKAGEEPSHISDKTTKRDRQKSSRSSKKGQNPRVSSSPKSKKAPLSPKEDSQDALNDSYCWICHREGEVLCCEKCPRVFHAKCLHMAKEPEGDWFCPECVKVTEAESRDMERRSLSMLTKDQFYMLLTHVIQRMKVPLSEPFHEPVDTKMLPDYVEYVFHPMDLSTMEDNIAKRKYGCPEAFLADFKWVVHNCILYNSLQSKLTQTAKLMLKVAERELKEIELCPECYLNSCRKGDSWFCEPCKQLHPLVWAKLQGFPHWPAKALRIEKGSIDVRFFGQHDRAWIPLTACFLISEDPPLAVKSKKLKGGLDSAIQEMQQYIENVKKSTGKFEYALPRTPFIQGDFYREWASGKVLLSAKNREAAEEKMPVKARADSTDNKGSLNLEIEQHEKIAKDDAGPTTALKASTEEGDSDSELVIDLGDIEESVDDAASGKEATKAVVGVGPAKKRKDDGATDSPSTSKPATKSILVNAPKPSGKSEKKKLLAKVLSEKIGGKRKHDADVPPAIAKIRKTREQSLEKHGGSPSDIAQKGQKMREKETKKSHYAGKHPEKEGSGKVKPGILKSSTDSVAPRREIYQSEKRISEPSKQKHKDPRDGAPKSILKKPIHSDNKPERLLQIPTGADTKKLFNGGRIPRKVPPPGDEDQERKEHRGNDAMVLDTNQSTDVRGRGADNPGLNSRFVPPRQPPGGKPTLQQKKGADQNITLASLRKYSDRVMDTVQKVFYEMYTDMMVPLTAANAGSEASAAAMHEVAQMRLELERLKWMHRQEIAELKNNHELTLTEIRQNVENEKNQLVIDTMRKADATRERMIEETKRKQWCACCGKEAMFFCCWNTSYCDYPCQQKHWPAHMAHCAQEKEALTQTTGATDSSLTAHQSSAPHSAILSSQTGASASLPTAESKPVSHVEENLISLSAAIVSSPSVAATAISAGKTQSDVTSSAHFDMVTSQKPNRTVMTSPEAAAASVTAEPDSSSVKIERAGRLSANAQASTSSPEQSFPLCSPDLDKATMESPLSPSSVQPNQASVGFNDWEGGEIQRQGGDTCVTAVPFDASHSTTAATSGNAEPAIVTSDVMFSSSSTETLPTEEMKLPMSSIPSASQSSIVSQNSGDIKDVQLWNLSEVEGEREKGLERNEINNNVSGAQAGWSAVQQSEPDPGGVFSATVVEETVPVSIADSILADEYLIDSAPVTEIEDYPLEQPPDEEGLSLPGLPDSDDDNLILLESADEQMESDNEGNFTAP